MRSWLSGSDVKLTAHWRDDPALMVRELFGAEPEPWQDKALRLYASTGRVSMVGSKGVGLSTTLAWMAWNFLLTRPDARVMMTAVSQDGWLDNMRSELGKWGYRLDGLRRDFIMLENVLYLRGARESHFLQYRPWSKADRTRWPDTFAGVLAENILILVDDAGSVPGAVLDATAALGDVKIVVGGIPLDSLDRDSTEYSVLWRARAEAWQTVHVSGDPDDPARCGRINIDWARDQIRNWGRESPWVQINVLGQWPSGSTLRAK